MTFLLPRSAAATTVEWLIVSLVLQGTGRASDASSLESEPSLRWRLQFLDFFRKIRVKCGGRLHRAQDFGLLLARAAKIS